MPVKYECYVCEAIFSYTQIEIPVQNPHYKNRFINIMIPCKHGTYTQGLGGTVEDYICGECIKRAVAND